jgi:hypothetical protein
MGRLRILGGEYAAKPAQSGDSVGDLDLDGMFSYWHMYINMQKDNTIDDVGVAEYYWTKAQLVLACTTIPQAVLFQSPSPGRSDHHQRPGSGLEVCT